MSILFGLTISLGFLGAFIAGVAGIGGAIIMVPLLYFVPPFFGAEKLSMQVVAGITIVQVLVATGTAALVHKSNNFINKQLVIWMGTSIIVGSFLGGLGSKYVDNTTLELIFAVLALIASVMMFIPKKEVALSEKLEFNKVAAVISALTVGILSGLIGAGGAFLLVPIMLYILKIPLRITIGSSLGIVFFSALSGFIGKVISGQIVWELALAIVLGAVPGAFLGGKTSKFIPGNTIRIFLALLITGSAIKMWINYIV